MLAAGPPRLAWLPGPATTAMPNAPSLIVCNLWLIKDCEAGILWAVQWQRRCTVNQILLPLFFDGAKHIAQQHLAKDRVASSPCEVMKGCARMQVPRLLAGSSQRGVGLHGLHGLHHVQMLQPAVATATRAHGHSLVTPDNKPVL